jgi:MSHA biogenesis protein MshJ
MSAALRTWWEARAGRERGLAIGALLVGLGAAVEILLFTPQRAHQLQQTREVEAAKARLSHLEASAAELANDGDHRLQARRQALRQRRDSASAAISAAHVDLIEPAEMGRQLAAILARHPQLQIVSMQSSPAAPLVGAGGVGDFYKHELQVQVAGNYLDLIAYLRALEQAPHRIYWRELDMKVDDQGVPLTRLTLFTLSKDTTWLKL